MRLRHLAIGAIALTVLTGCLPASSTSRRDINDLKQSSYQSRKDIAENKKALARINATMADIPKEQSLTAIRQSQTTLLNRVSDLYKEVQAITGTMETGVNDARKLSRDTAAQLDVMKASGGGSDALEARLNAIEIEVAIIKKKLAMRDSTTATTPVKDTPTAVLTPDDVYKAAHDTFKKKKYKKAREDFLRFIKDHPKHKWAGNAQFWIAETYYGEGTYGSAILAYDDVLRKYPKSTKVPDAMLKQGMAFIKLDDPLSAKGAFTEVVTKHPKSKAADQARKKLKGLK